MKRIFSAILVFCLLCSGLVLSESGSSTPTVKRGLVEYAQLCMERAQLIEADGLHEFDDLFITSIPAFDFADDYYMVSTAFGSVEANKEDLSVDSAYITVYTYDPATGKVVDYLGYEALAAFSALEANQLAEQDVAMQYQYLGGQYKDIIYQYIPAFSSYVEKVLQNNTYFNRIYNGERLKVCTGNYDYYLTATKMENDKVEFILNAKARE